MAILIVAGFTIPVKGPDGVVQNDEEIGGDRARMFDGTMRQTVRSVKRNWTVTTRLLTASERTSLYAALRGPAPLACSGDALGGSASCFATINSDQQMWTKGQIRYAVAFRLMEQ